MPDESDEADDPSKCPICGAQYESIDTAIWCAETDEGLDDLMYGDPSED